MVKSAWSRSQTTWRLLAERRGVDWTMNGSHYRFPITIAVYVEPAEAMEHQALLSGLIRLHILHHAVEGELYGQWMIEELARHGYRLSPGTLYPLLHGMEKKGYLKSRRARAGRSARRLYRATPLGREVLRTAREKVKELFGELVEGPRTKRHRHARPTRRRLR